MPYVGEIVHYVSYGTPGGEYKSECRAAIITEVPERDACALAVLNPEGMYFARCLYDGSDQPRPGTWHAAYSSATLSTPCPGAKE